MGEGNGLLGGPGKGITIEMEINKISNQKGKKYGWFVFKNTLNPAYDCHFLSCTFRNFMIFLWDKHMT